jgi:hypothetical protein
MKLYHRFTRDEDYLAIFHHGLFKSMEEMVEFQKNDYLKNRLEEEHWETVADPDYVPDNEFIFIDIIESKEWAGEREIVTVCKMNTGETFNDESYLFKEIDTDTLKNGGLFD